MGRMASAPCSPSFYSCPSIASFINSSVVSSSYPMVTASQALYQRDSWVRACPARLLSFYDLSHPLTRIQRDFCLVVSSSSHIPVRSIASEHSGCTRDTGNSIVDSGLRKQPSGALASLWLSRACQSSDTRSTRHVDKSHRV